jgi:hypothetical protein
MKRMKKAEKKINEGTQEIEKATKKMDENIGLSGMVSSIGSFFTPSTENKEEEAPKEEPILEEEVPEEKEEEEEEEIKPPASEIP